MPLLKLAPLAPADARTSPVSEHRPRLQHRRGPGSSRLNGLARLLGLAGLASGLAACNAVAPSEASPQPGQAEQAPAAQTKTERPRPLSSESEREDDPVDRTSQAQQTLAGLDPRTPVPLHPMMAWHQKQNMMNHLLAVQAITTGLAQNDWAAIADAGRDIGSSQQMQQMCEHMGAATPGFTERALAFHQRADAIVTAAEGKDSAAVLSALAHTLAACTSCHATYRQDVVDLSTWQNLTNTQPEGSEAHP